MKKQNSNSLLTKNHSVYRTMLENEYPVLCIGSQGTGKTYGAVEEAVRRLKLGTGNGIRKIIVARPNVPFADTMGFLPGTDQEKLAPWVRPVRDLFLKFMSHGELEIHEKNRVIEYVAFEHIQGLTFDNAFVILDECQNTSFDQLQIFLGRQGVYSKYVLCGDVRQVSPKFKNSGLAEFSKLVRHPKINVRCNIIEFTLDDCVRSDQCKHWLESFELWEEFKY